MAPRAQQPGKTSTMAPQTSTTQQPAKPKIRYLGRTSYTVESRTRPGHIHHVDTYRLTCSCEAGRYGKRCWALVAALGYEDWRRRLTFLSTGPQDTQGARENDDDQGSTGAGSSEDTRERDAWPSHE